MKKSDNKKVTLTIGQLRKLVKESVFESDEEPRVKQISFDIIMDPAYEDSAIKIFRKALEDAAKTLGDAYIVGGPDFTDASWSPKEYGL